jgi:hypothetical protein
MLPLSAQSAGEQRHPPNRFAIATSSIDGLGGRPRLKTQASDVDAEAYLRQALVRNPEKVGRAARDLRQEGEDRE